VDEEALIKMVVVDDHPVVRFGVRQMLTSGGNIEVVAELDDIDTLAEVLAENAVDIVLLDLELEHTHGVDALRILREVSPDVRVIIYTSHDDEDRIVQAAELGVDGYLLKGCGQRELLDAVHSVYDGGTALESSVASKLMKHMNRRSSRNDVEAVRFSKRETQVLEQLASGSTNREIGTTLFISESTVKFHVHAILSKFDASNRTEAVSIAAKLGIIELKVDTP
jgi:DNA-binding NarL/FixJ family response regulator